MEIIRNPDLLDQDCLSGLDKASTHPTFYTGVDAIVNEEPFGQQMQFQFVIKFSSSKI
jgi:hypothetical protein